MRRRSVAWLFGSCAAYWAALFAIKLGPAVIAIWRAAQVKEPNQSSVGFSVGNWLLNLIVTVHGQTTWSGAIHVGALAAWIGVVPLAIWLAWFMSTKSDTAVRAPV